MLPDSYQDWISIYDPEFHTTWEEERSDLRKLAMIYFAFHKELNNLKQTMDHEFNEMKTSLKKKHYLDKCRNFKGLAQSEKYDVAFIDKENNSPDNVPLKENNFNDPKTEDFFIESPDTSDFFKEKSPSPKPVKKKLANSPILNKNSFTKSRKKTPSPSHEASRKTPVTYKKTPKNICDDSNIMECSIIEDTPDAKPAKKPKSILQLRKLKKTKLSQSKQSTTLTQMFFEPRKSKRTIDSNMASMGVSEMINLINESSGSDTDAGLDQSDETLDELEVPVVNDPVPQNLKSFVENYDKIPEKKNEGPNFAYKEVVRGNARKKLKGWSCNECKDYYEALNLPPDELEKKKNVCSRHRQKFKPREDTYDGFWDLTFGPTPKTQDTEESLVFKV